MNSLNCLRVMRSMTVAATLLLLVASGCATTRSAHPASSPETAVADTAPRDMVYISGGDNARISWDAVVARAKAADIIVLGEQHDDAVGHRVQAALVAALVAGNRVAVCLEMLERDEQAFVDAYLSGDITQETLADVTDSKDWGGKGKWEAFYQPIVDAAKESGSPVIAANAPRRFTRLARAENFDALAKIAPAYPGQFVTPAPIVQEDYAERFKDTMRHHSAPPAPKDKRKKKKTKKEAHAMPPLSKEKVESFFRAQQVWDATMADSVVRSYQTHGKALLIVGQFHTDHDGGLLLRMKAAAPDATYLTISIQQDAANAVREEDQGRADVVVYRPVER